MLLLHRLKRREGDNVPFFIFTKPFRSLIRKETIVKLAEEFLRESSNYLIDVQVSASNKIRVYIENDEHVSIQECIKLSRYIEHSLDRESEDFELEVSSPGIDQPFKNERQYKKYVGKDVSVLLTNGSKVDGVLIELKDNHITILPAPMNKAKKQSTINSFSDKTQAVIPLADVKETRLIIVF